MHSISSLWKASIFLIILYGCSEPKKQEVETSAAPPLQVDTVNTLNATKIELTREYSRIHYGIDDHVLTDPKMIVIHHTVIPTLKQTLELFKNDHISTNRNYIKKYSTLNVGIHYVIDKDGSIYSLTPDTVMARHIIGFNHVSIGIENVASKASDLTQRQLLANTELVKHLSEKHESIKYIIGHDEYNDKSLPHYQLFKSLDPSYQPYDKPDPGKKFMYDLRMHLKEEHGLEFLK